MLSITNRLPPCWSTARSWRHARKSGSTESSMPSRRESTIRTSFPSRRYAFVWTMRDLTLPRSTGWRTRSILRFAARNFRQTGGRTAKMEHGVPAVPRQGWRRRRQHSRRKLGRALKFVPHHLAHAASAYYPSGFDPAAILVIDGIGEAACSTLARGEGTRIETIETFSYPHSLGFVWEQASIISAFRPTMPPRSWASPPMAIPMSVSNSWRRSFR